MRATHDRFTIAFLCGAPGAGKSYTSALDVLDRLKADDTARIKTNLPINLEVMAARAAEETGKPAEEFAARLVLLPREKLSRWAEGFGGPWDEEADGWDMLLDEIHLFCPTEASDEQAKQWKKWLGEARHDGWRRLVFITQDQAKVHKAITMHAELRFELTSSERIRDPFTRIPLASWYELAASWTRRYSAPILIQEYTRELGKLKAGYREWVYLQEKNFELYNSYVASGGGTKEGGVKARRYQYQQRPTWLPSRIDRRLKMPVWGWFLGRHGHQVAWPFVVATLCLWLCFGGGLQLLIKKFTERFHVAAMGKEAPTGEVVKSQQVEQVTPEQFFTLIEKLEAADRRTAEGWIDQQASIETELKDQVATLEAENRELAGKILAEKKLVAIHDGMTWWDSGEQIKPGERLEGGGPEIELIDEQRRIVALVGGRRVRLGGVLRYREEPAEFDPRLERGLQESGGRGTGQGVSPQGAGD